MSNNNEHIVSCKVWLELHGEPLIGKGGAKILETIKQVESISKAAKKTGMSYRYVWNYLSKLERRLGEPVVMTFKGGKKGGGGAKLTKLGYELLQEYEQAENCLTKSMSVQSIDCDVDQQNRVKGTIQQITNNLTGSTVEFTLESQTNLTISIPKKTVNDLNLSPKDDIEVTIKATKLEKTKDTAKKN